MKKSTILSITSLILVGALTAHAQVDPSSAILLRSGGRAPTKGEFESDRYSIRPEAAKPSRTNTSEKSVVEKSTVKTETEVQTPSVTVKTSVDTTAEVKAPELIEIRQPSKSDKKVQQIEITEPEKISGDTPASVEPVAVEKKSDSEEDKKSLIKDLRQIFLGGTSEEVDLYLGKVEASDPRNNILEFTVAPMLYYNDSSSNYWYRDYYSYGPGINLNAKFWVSPFFGVSTTYQTTFNTEINSSALDTATEPVDHQWFGAELQFRSYFGVSRRAPSLTLGLGYNEYGMKAKSDSVSRIGVKTSGVKISFESMIPVTRGTAWTMGVDLQPRAVHKENRSQISPVSGKHDQTNIVGLSVGKKYTFSRSQVVFWKLQHSFEKNSFKNQASDVDPKGRQPSNVSVTNTRSLFLFGFTWGN